MYIYTEFTVGKRKREIPTILRHFKHVIMYKSLSRDVSYAIYVLLLLVADVVHSRQKM